MDKEDVIEYSGYLNPETLDGIRIPNLEKIDGELTNKPLSKILGTDIRTDVVYFFDYKKLIDLFDSYTEKFSTTLYDYYIEENFPVKLTEDYRQYRIFPSECGIKDITDVKKVNTTVNIVKGIQVIEAQISIDAHGGEQRGWGGSPFYRIQLFKFNEEKPNFVVYADFIDADLLCEFLSKLISCIVCVNKNDLIDRIKDLSAEVKNMLINMNKLSDILSENIKEKR